jgi:hypothetical protein
MTDHTSKPRNIGGKPRFAISAFIQIHPALHLTKS